MFLTRFIIASILLYFFEFSCFAQNSILFKGLTINRSTNYPLSKVRTNLEKVKTWGDSIVYYETSYGDTLGSLKYEISELATKCKSLVFKEISYVNEIRWEFKKSDSQIILYEIHFDNPKKRKIAYYFMRKNMANYEPHMVGVGYYDWFMAGENIYLIQLNHNEGLESDIDYLNKSKIAFIKMLSQ